MTPMKKALVTLWSQRYSPASQVIVLSAEKSSRELGFGVLLESDRAGHRLTYGAKFAWRWLTATVFLALYPYSFHSVLRINPARSIEGLFLQILSRIKRTSSILYILDLPIHQNIAYGNFDYVDNRAYELERSLLWSFDVLCVVNDAMMRELIRRYNLPENKFVEYEIGDYEMNFVPQKRARLLPDRFVIVVAGNLNKRYVGEWIRKLPYTKNLSFEFFGSGGAWISEINRGDIQYKGFLDPEQFLNYAATKCDFGLITYANRWTEYLTYTCTSKFSAYVSAGLPVIVTSKSEYASRLVEKYGVGVVVRTLDELSYALKELSSGEYEQMRSRCFDLGEKLRRGFFFKLAMAKASDKLGERGISTHEPEEYYEGAVT